MERPCIHVCINHELCFTLLTHRLKRVSRPGFLRCTRGFDLSQLVANPIPLKDPQVAEVRGPGSADARSRRVVFNGTGFDGLRWHVPGETTKLGWPFAICYIYYHYLS